MQMLASSKNQFSGKAHPLLSLLSTIAFVIVLIKSFSTIRSNWQEATFLIFATLGTLTALMRQLPAQNVVLAAIITAVIGGGISTLSAKSGIPFGPFTFGSAAGPQLFKTL